MFVLLIISMSSESKTNHMLVFASLMVIVALQVMFYGGEGREVMVVAVVLAVEFGSDGEGAGS